MCERFKVNRSKTAPVRLLFRVFSVVKVKTKHRLPMKNFFLKSWEKTVYASVGLWWWEAGKSSQNQPCIFPNISPSSPPHLSLAFHYYMPLVHINDSFGEFSQLAFETSNMNIYLTDNWLALKLQSNLLGRE